MPEKKREDRRWKPRKWFGHDVFGCTRCEYVATTRGAIVEHARTLHPLRGEGEPPNPLHGVPFASDEAAELAASVPGLTAAHMRELPASGVSGFTVADVRLAARAITTEE